MITFTASLDILTKCDSCLEVDEPMSKTIKDELILPNPLLSDVLKTNHGRTHHTQTTESLKCA